MVFLPGGIYRVFAGMRKVRRYSGSLSSWQCLCPRFGLVLPPTGLKASHVFTQKAWEFYKLALSEVRARHFKLLIASQRILSEPCRKQHFAKSKLTPQLRNAQNAPVAPMVQVEWFVVVIASS